MQVFYEESGGLRVGTVLADNNTSLQVEALHGKRTKVKAAHVLLRFAQPGAAEFITRAQQVADEVDPEFLWQCCGADEFSYDELAREYFGREPTPPEAGGVLMRLHGSPVYFYKKGHGRYRAAPEEALQAALASIERKRRQAEQQAAYVDELRALRLPEAFRPLLKPLLYRPDRSSIEWKALEAAAIEMNLTPAHLIERCGALPSSHDYHLERFLFEFFPHGTGFTELPQVTVPDDLPLADVAAFSIDDASTTEIDDAFSVTRLDDGGWRIGLHIAAPALGIAPGSELDRVARERLSTVYYPGGKITMLPPPAIAAFSLDENRQCPALSLYFDVTPDGRIEHRGSRVERVPVAANLRHEQLEAAFNEQAVAAGHIDHRFGAELLVLWKAALQLEAARGKADAPQGGRVEYSFHVDGDRVRIVPRKRGSPIDRVVAEMAIFANSRWGGDLAANGVAAIFRVQGNGKVKMSTLPAGHEGLGVAQYVWATSPLRRYADLVNQRQLVALTRATPPDSAAGGDELLAAMREFEAAYDAYAEFQFGMERYWCLRWLLQENVAEAGATVIRENLVRFDELPLVVRVASLPAVAPGTHVRLAVSAIDLLERSLHCEFRASAAEPQ
jgi:exoribonuclease-2